MVPSKLGCHTSPNSGFQLAGRGKSKKRKPLIVFTQEVDQASRIMKYTRPHRFAKRGRARAHRRQEPADVIGNALKLGGNYA